jgi:hypothetical protein
VASWEDLIGPATGIGLSAAGGFAYAAWRGWRGRRSLPAVRAGRRVAIPVLVDAEQDAPGLAVLDGNDLRVVTARHHLLLAREEVGRSATRRAKVDEDLAEVADLRGYVDDSGQRYFVGPTESWWPTFDALLAAPARPAGRLQRLRAGLPRSAVAVALVALVAAGLFQAIWWSGHDVPATMVRLVAGEEGDSCAVSWHDGARPEHAEVDCYEPYPRVGSTVTVRALAWPFDESAMDREGSFEGITSLTVGPAILAVVVGLVLAARRLRRPVVRLRAPKSPTAGMAPPRRAEVEDQSLRELVRQVSRQEDWVGEATVEPPPRRWWQPLAMSLAAGRWWPAAALLAAAWVPESLPDPWRYALSAGALAVLLWAAYRALAAWLVISRAARGTVTSEWDYQLVRTEDELWFVLLLLGDTPQWAVVLGSEEHPRPEGRCGVRGDLREGGAIQLLIEGRYWVGGSPVLRCDDEFRRDVREDLVERLGREVGQSPDFRRP